MTGGEILINAIVGDNIRRIRHSRELTIERLSELTGVSRSLLGQIERGEANPTMATIWKIANGFKIPFSKLTEMPDEKVGVVDKDQLIRIQSDDGAYECTPFFPFEANQGFEMYAITQKSGFKSQGEPHPKGTMEYLIVFDGELLITVGEETHRVEQDQAIKFLADIPHSYDNRGDKTARYVDMVYYPQGI